MKALIATLAVLFIVPAVWAEHPPLKEGEVYKINAIIACKAPETLVKAHETFEESGRDAVRAFLKEKMQEGACAPIRGAVKYTGKKFATWESGRMVFELIEFETPQGRKVYTTRQYKKHWREA